MSLIGPLSRLIELQSLRFKFWIDFIQGNISISLFPNSSVHFSLTQPQIIFSELHTLCEKPVQLSFQGRHGDFSFQTEFATLSRSRSLSFLSTQFFRHLKVTHYLARISGRTTNLRLAMNLSHLMMLPPGYRLLMKTRDTEGLTSRSWESFGDVDRPTSFISGGSQAATVVVRSL